MFVSCPGCDARYRMPAGRGETSPITCPRCGSVFPASPEEHVPVDAQPNHAVMTVDEQTHDETLPPNAMAMIELWDDPDSPSTSTSSLLDETPPPAPHALPGSLTAVEPSTPQASQNRTPPTEERARRPIPGGAAPSAVDTVPPANRAVDPELDSRHLARRLVEDSIGARKPPPASTGPSLKTWAGMAVFVALFGGAGAVAANLLFFTTPTNGAVAAGLSAPLPDVVLPEAPTPSPPEEAAPRATRSALQADRPAAPAMVPASSKPKATVPAPAPVPSPAAPPPAPQTPVPKSDETPTAPIAPSPTDSEPVGAAVSEGDAPVEATEPTGDDIVQDAPETVEAPPAPAPADLTIDTTDLKNPFDR